MSKEVKYDSLNLNNSIARNPFYDDYLFIEIIIYLPFKKIILMEQLSKYHCNIIRNHRWQSRIIVNTINQITDVLQFHHLQRWGITMKSDMNHITTHSCDSPINSFLKKDIYEKLRYSTIIFVYARETLTLFESLIKLSKDIIFYSHNNNATVITYSEEILTIMTQNSKPFEYCSSPEITHLLVSKNTEIQKILSDAVMKKNAQQLLYKLSKTIYFKYFEPSNIQLPQLFEAIYLFDLDTISLMENNVELQQKIVSKRKYKWYLTIKKKCLCALIPSSEVQYDNETNFTRDTDIVYYCEYNNNYLEEQCKLYELDIVGVKKKLEKHINNNFKDFFVWWQNTPSRQDSFTREFIILNMLHAIRCYYPTHISTFVHQYIQQIINQPEYANTLKSACMYLVLFFVDNQMIEMLCYLIDILYSNIDKSVSSILIKQVMQLACSRIIIASDSYALLRIYDLWEVHEKSLLLPPILLLMNYPNKYKQYASMFVDVLKRTIANYDSSFELILMCYESTFHRVTRALSNAQPSDVLAYWIKLLIMYYGTEFKKYYCKVYNKQTFSPNCNLEMLICCKQNNLPLRLNYGIQFWIEMLCIQEEKFLSWQEIIPIKKDMIGINVLTVLIDVMTQKSVLLKAFERWYNLSSSNSYPDSDYHLVLEKICSRGVVKLLEWWKNKGLPFHYTKKAFDLASNAGHKKILLWWIQNCSSKSLVTRNARHIQYGGCYKNGQWETPQNMILLYSHCGLFNPSSMICEIWKYYNLNIIHKKSVLKKIKDSITDDDELQKKLCIFIKYFGEQ